MGATLALERAFQPLCTGLATCLEATSLEVMPGARTDPQAISTEAKTCPVVRERRVQSHRAWTTLEKVGDLRQRHQILAAVGIAFEAAKAVCLATEARPAAQQEVAHHWLIESA